MPVSLTIDARKNISLTGTSATPVVLSADGNTLRFVDSSGTQSLSTPNGWTSITIATGLTLNIPATLADGKAFLGAGTAVAVATASGQNLSGLNLGVDVIQLNAGFAYQLTAAQAAMARIGASGSVGNLVSTGVITVVATDAGDLSGLVTDGNDIIQLTAGLNYTLTAAQAATARVGATGTAGSFLSTAGSITIRADAAADLSNLRTDSNDTLILTAGRDYVLSSSQVGIAQVGTSNKGVLATAGTITVKAASAGEVLSSISATGIDILLLTPGANYTVTPAQAAVARMGSSGVAGDLTSSGVVTIKADLAGENLASVQVDSNDVIQLGAGFNYTLTTLQASRARVGTAGSPGNLQNAGLVTLVANPAGENLSAATILGADAFVLSPNMDYTLTLSQAMASRVSDGGALRDLRGAGNVVVRANSGEDLTVLSGAQGVLGIDGIQLTSGATTAYTLTAAQARVARVDASGRPGNLTGAGPVTVVASGPEDLSGLTNDSNDILVLSPGVDYTLSAAQVPLARVGAASAAPGSLFKAGLVRVIAAPGDDLSTLAAANFTGIDAIVLTAGQKYTLATSQGAIAQVGAGGTPGVLTGLGPITVRAINGEDLTTSSNLATAAPVAAIVLTPGQSYTLTPAQALMARFGSGAAGDLRQTGAATAGQLLIDASAPSGSTVDLSSLVTDANVFINASTTGTYTVTAAQALNTRVLSSGGGASAFGDLSTGGIFTIKADVSADLSNLVLRTGDQLLLSAGRSYTLASHHVPLSRVGNFNFGDLDKTAQVFVRANPNGEDLSGIANFSGIDGYTLTAGAAYTLTASQAALSRMGSATATPGSLVSTAKLIIRGDVPADMSALTTDSGDEVWLQPTLSYTLNSTQALTARLLDSNGIPGTSQQLTSSGTITVRASTASTGEDLTLLSGVAGIDAYILGATSAYRLTAAQAEVARVGAGAAGNLTGTGVLTVVADTGRDVSSIRLDTNDILQLADGADYTLTATQAAIARIGSAGTAGALASTGVLTILAPTSASLNTIATDANDKILLAPDQRYTLTTAQAAIARVLNGSTEGAPGALTGAGMIRLLAGTAAEDLTALTLDSGDVIQLNPATAYTLTANQAAIAQMGATGTLGNLVSTAAITVTAPASADLTSLVFDANDRIVLAGTRNYTLTSAQAQIALNEGGTVGDLSGSGTVTVRASRTGEDLATAAMSGVTGIDAYQLWPMQNYTLTAAQALISRVGTNGSPANFSSAGTITIRGSSSGENLTGLSAVPGIDGYLLTSGVSYSLTPAQASVARMVSGSTTSAAGLLTSTGALTINATNAFVSQSGADLSGLTLDSGDTVLLSPGLDYTLTPLQAAVARVVNSGTGTPGAAGALGAAGLVTMRANPLGGDDLSTLNVSGIDAVILGAGRNYTLSTALANVSQVVGSPVGNLSKAGFIVVRAASAGENLATGLTASNVDLIQLAPDVAYTLTSAQAAVARIGSGQTPGSLVSSGALTVLANGSTDFTRLTLDAGDSIVMTSGAYTYTLTPLQANIGRIGTGTAGSLADPAQINVLAAPLGDDLSRMSANGVDAILLAAGSAYTLTSAQAALARVGSWTAPAGQLSKAGSITLRSSGGETFTSTNLSNWSVDVLQLTGSTTSVTYTIPSTALSGLRLQVGTGSGAGYQALTLVAATDADATNDNLIGAYSNPLGTSASAVDFRGEWSFNTSTKVFSFHDGTAVQTIVLTGVSWIEADGTALLRAS